MCSKLSFVMLNHCMSYHITLYSCYYVSTHQWSVHKYSRDISNHRDVNTGHVFLDKAPVRSLWSTDPRLFTILTLTKILTLTLIRPSRPCPWFLLLFVNLTELRPKKFTTDLYIYILDAVPPVHVVWNHVDTDKLTTANGWTCTSSSASLSSQSR